MPAPSKRTPSSDPHRSLRAVTIPNPYYSPAHDDEAGNPRTVPAIVNIRESAVTMLASRGRIDAAQLAAATRFRALWEAMSRSTRAIDYGREPVDGGGHADPISHRQMHAAEELRRIRPLLGEEGYSLVSRICGEGYSIGEVVRPGSSKRAKLKAARDLREFLDLLCEFWNLSTRR
ncbi:hypothetical protein [Rhizobium ruizarguesonis]|jgi:hypothetical protein|uniref:Uncharacterized protein n=1 Tax=Rhizobium ruizarguesonis TaxID=2081791 RepID=A0AB38I615_9HYPH|nr:hypothetical protein [Rhizobium ruizarguesonis]NEI28693.1 hypothetical protein [Rhizobium ruizarguesonis]TAY93506.1 hypothetical protein ELH85_10155 [Rhizobium ruizarguesonis]TAZ78144.1 hypothetical protein ELH68_10355 [Rhizobium ruizarguesonis]TBA04521.1 hypothetical protein ELH64_08915 [Rhizobium ruizarguesonis]TBA25929.1 hypothetical protein ELH61_09050 [Rhizobium ruizarguesonis]